MVSRGRAFPHCVQMQQEFLFPLCMVHFMQLFLSHKKGKSLHDDNGNNRESVCVISGDGLRTPATPDCCLTYSAPPEPTAPEGSSKLFPAPSRLWSRVERGSMLDQGEHSIA